MRYQLVALCILLGVVGCSGGATSDQRIVQFPADAPVAETVNGVAVPRALLEALARGRGWDLAKPEQRERAYKEITDYILLAQAAQREKFVAAPEFQADVEIARLQATANATVLAFQRQMVLADDVLRAEYDQQVERAGNYDYDFRQLIFADEDAALKAAGEVIAGKPFSQVYDTWKDKAKQAKVFNRVRLDQLPEALGKTLAELKTDETTKVPVKTQFGWHVVHLDIANPFAPPPFDQVKEGIRRTLLQRLAQERLLKLKEQAQVSYPEGSTPIVTKPAKTEAKAQSTDAPPAKPGKDD